MIAKSSIDSRKQSMELTAFASMCAQIHGVHLSYAFWISALHGYLYQLVLYGAVGDEANIRSEAESMWARFHLIQPDREATPAVRKEEMLTTFDSDDFGVSMDLSNLGWRRSASIAKKLPSAILCGVRSEATFFTLQAFRLGELNPPINYIARAACVMHQVSLDDATNIHQSSNDGVDAYSFEVSHVDQGVKLTGFYKILARTGFAYILHAETSIPAEIQNLSALADQIHLQQKSGGSSAPLSKEAGKSQMLLLNNIGIQYEDGKQFAKAAIYFAAALDCSPDLNVATNLIGADEEIGNYRNALDAANRGLRLFPKQSTLLAAQARLQGLLNDPHSAAATYHNLFATDFRDDLAFRQYLLLLQKQGKTDDAIAEAKSYLAKTNSESVSIDLALLYDNKGQFARAIDLLRERWAKEPANVRVGINLALVLVDDRQFDEAAKIARQLIASGSDDAATYLVLGEAQFGLNSYRQAKDSFETGQQKAPNNETFKKWIDLSSAKLGEGDNSIIKKPIDPVEIPSDLLSDDPVHPLPAPDISQDAWYVRHITAISFVPNKNLKTSEYRLIKVLNQHGVEKFSKFEFPFDSLSERIYLNKLEVRDDQGRSVATTDVSHCFVTDENQAESHSFRKVLDIPVSGLKANDTIEILVTREDISPPSKMPYTFELICASEPGGMEAVYLTGKTDSVKSVQSVGFPPKPVDKGLCWSLSPLPQYRYESQQPLLDTFLPYVALGDKDLTWEGVAKEYLDSISGLMDPAPSVTALSEQLTRGISSDAQKVAAIAKYVQHDYTYTAIEFGRRAHTQLGR